MTLSDIHGRKSGTRASLSQNSSGFLCYSSCQPCSILIYHSPWGVQQPSACNTLSYPWSKFWGFSPNSDLDSLQSKRVMFFNLKTWNTPWQVFSILVLAADTTHTMMQRNQPSTAHLEISYQHLNRRTVQLASPLWKFNDLLTSWSCHCFCLHIFPSLLTEKLRYVLILELQWKQNSYIIASINTLFCLVCIDFITI